MASAFKLIGKLLKKNKKEDEEETDEETVDPEGAADAQGLSLDATNSTPQWKTGDRVTLNLDGIGEVVVPRGDMSEDEWNKFLEEAQKKQRLRSNEVVRETVADREERTKTGKNRFEDRPKSDYMEVTVGKGRGEVAVVPRGDMDQTEWEALKNRAKKMGVFKGSNDTIKEKIQNADAILSTPELERRRGQMSDSTGMDADAEEPTEATKPTRVDEDNEDLKRDLEIQRSDAGGARGIKKLVGQGLTGTLGGRGGDVGTVQSIDPEEDELPPLPQGKKVRGNVEIGEAEIGANPGKTIDKGLSRQLRTAEAQQATAAGIDSGLSKQVTGAATAQDEQRAAVEKALEPVRTAGAAALESANKPGALVSDLMLEYGKPASDAMDTIGRGLQGVGHGLLPRTIPAPTQPGSVMTPPPNPAAAGAPPDVTGLPGGAPGPVGAGVPPGAVGGAPGGSMSMSASRSGGPVPEAGMPDRTAEIDKAYSQAARAQMAQADLESKGLEQKAKMFDDGIKEQTRQQAKIIEIQDRQRVEREKPMAIYNQMLSELMQPTQKIDPHRWWNSRSTGQKIMLALGALLTKGGTNRMVQSAIDSDLAAQQQEISTEIGRKKAVMGAADNMLGMIRQQGADDVQAAQIYKAMSWDMVAKRLEMVAANTDSQTIKMKAEQNIAEANVQRSKLLTEMDKYSADLAIRKAHLANESEMVSIKRQKALGGGKPKKLEHLKGPQVSKIAALQTAVAKTAELEAQFKKNNGGAMEAMLNKGTQNIPGTKSNRYNYDAEMNIANIADTLGNAGVLQPGEVERYKKIHPQAGDIDGAYRLKSLREDIQRRLEKELAAFKAAGYDVADLESAMAAEAEPSTFQPDEAE